jgi:hypothetical protein
MIWKGLKKVADSHQKHTRRVYIYNRGLILGRNRERYACLFFDILGNSVRSSNF